MVAPWRNTVSTTGDVKSDADKVALNLPPEALETSKYIVAPPKNKLKKNRPFAWLSLPNIMFPELASVGMYPTYIIVVIGFVVGVKT